MTRRELYSGPISWMARNPVTANLLMVALIVGGILMSLRVRKEVFPSFELDIIQVSVPYPGASPAEVEQGILLAVEEAVRPLEGVKEVRSTAREGVGTVEVELERRADRNKTLADAKNAIDRITSFPLDAEEPIVMLPEHRHEAIWLVLYGDVDKKTLHALGERTRDQLLEEPEISQVELDGVLPLEISIEVPEERLRTYGLTLSGIASKVKRTALDLPAGGVKTRGGEVLLRTAERRDMGEEFADIPIVTTDDGSTVRLGDLAQIKDGFRESDFSASFEGKNVVWLRVYSVGEQSPPEVAEATKKFARKLQRELPPGVQSTTWRDRAKIYSQRLDLLLRNAKIGLVLVLVILGLFLEPRLAFWVTMGIPISFLGSFLLLPLLDVSLNMISLFAFIVTLGMVVDDAIVVGENAFRLKRSGLPPLKAAIQGAKEVATPVFFSIATTLVAFSPLLFVPGVRGKIFKVIPIVVILVLVLSLIESFFILPAHLAHLKPRPWLDRLFRWQIGVSRAVERFVEQIYGPGIERALNMRWITLAIGVAIFLAIVGVVRGGVIKFIDFPREESDWVVVKAKLPYGVPVEDTREVMEYLIKTGKEVIEENGGARIAEGIASVIGREGSHDISVYVTLVPSDQRPIGSNDFAAKWRDKIGDLPGLESLIFDAVTGPPQTPPIDIRLSHSDTEVLEIAAGELAAAYGTFNGLKDIDDGIEWGKEQLDFSLSPEGIAAGLTTTDLAVQVRSAFFGVEALRQQRGRNEVRVLVRLPRAERESLTSVEQLIVKTPAGGEMPLRRAANVKMGRAYTAIHRTDGRRSLRVKAEIDEKKTNAEEVMGALLEKQLPDLRQRFAGLSYKRAGRQKDMQDFYSFLITAFALALLGIYGLLAVPLRSYLQPIFVVMMAIPFGFVGAVLGHLIMGLNWSMTSWMGLVALSGVVVNDSIVLVTAANRFRGEGQGPRQAARSAAEQRFRPIILTSLTTFGGLAPMILERSVQARVVVPMAVGLGFGVLFSTLVILFLVPCLFVIIENVRIVFAGRARSIPESQG